MQSGQVESPSQTESTAIPSPVASSEQATTKAVDKGCAHPANKLTTLFPARDFITGRDFTVAHCDECSFDVTAPQPRTEEMATYYPSGYYGAGEDRRFPHFVETLENALYTLRVREIEAVANNGPGRVLDVGCGRGVLLEEFRRRGWEIHGTELSEQAASYARQTLKIPVEIGTLETLHFPANQFDAITLWHVLEHVANPRTVLAQINRILKPDGVLLVNRPRCSPENRPHRGKSDRKSTRLNSS